ncbi:hypothetical protein JW979_06680 [bacterium]|nr:hypothetical protein [candidate division CSSED10-310 bacterium]
MNHKIHYHILAGVMFLFFIIGVSAVHAGVFFGFNGGYYLASGWSDTHDLIYGGDGNYCLGLEAGYAFHFPLEVSLNASFISKNGNRVWPDGNGGWESTGESITYDMMPINLIARWRFIREGIFSPYVGAGLGYVQFDETGESTKNGEGFLLVGGGDFFVHQWMKLFVELEWASYADVIGNAGASRYFGEGDLSGLSARTGVRFTF